MPLDQVDIEKNEKNMSFLDHLEALRWHLMRSVVAIIVFSIVAMVNYRFIFDKIIFAVTKKSFPIYQLFCKLSYTLYGTDKLCFDSIDLNTQNLAVSGQFIYLMVVSFTIGLILSAPYILWEFWRFFKPALKPTEQKYTTGIVLATSLLFFIGVLFGYLVLAPLSVNFFINFKLTDNIVNHFTMQSYVSFVSTLTLASGVVFELPLIVFFLAKLGLVSSDFLKRYRRHAVVIILVLASVITPPDIMSQILLTIPVYLLYEVGIFIAKRIETKEKLNEA
ncbi:MAG: twin-arginine translocase subunit TatC [Bacteroidetes bacterium]|jgi:sec-independent protein translocase protein TatC|nr:twin-arginine translocase subunit TatC [Bacteroidota bacterium]